MNKLTNEYSQLDNPIWNTLISEQSKFSISFGDLLAYRPEIAPFSGVENPYSFSENIKDEINMYSTHINDFFVVGGDEPPNYPNSVSFKNHLICKQMLLENPIEIDYTEEIIPLDESHSNLVHHFVLTYFPGYFKPKTMLLGDYFGIFKGNQLVAVAGERMKTDVFTEISTIVTHPDFQGKGLAKQLTVFLSQKIFQENKIPFLHTGQKNFNAIALYEKLGFQHRKEINFWNFEHNKNL